MDAGDFTVINIDTTHPKGHEYARALAEVTGGTIVTDWLSEGTYSYCAPLPPEKEIASGGGIDLLVMPKGWTRLDTMALINHIVSCNTLPPAPLSVVNDGDIGCSIMELKLKADTGAIRDNSASVRFTLMGDTDISVLASRGLSMERNILKSVAMMSGGQYAARLISDEHDLKDTLAINTAGLGVSAEKMPDMASDRMKVLQKIFSVSGVQSLVSPQKRNMLMEILSDAFRVCGE